MACVKNFLFVFAGWLKNVPAELLDLIKNRQDFKFYPELWIVIAAAVLAYPAGLYLPVELGYENNLIENTQLALLFLAMLFCWLVKHNRSLFRFFSAIIFIMVLREVNFGKTLFYPDPVHPNEFLRWDEIPYAAWVDPVMIIYGIWIAIYFLRKKLFMVIPAFIRSGRIPVWYVVITGCCVISMVLIDKLCKNPVLEEMIEMAVYVAVAAGVRRTGSADCQWIPETEKNSD